MLKITFFFHFYSLYSLYSMSLAYNFALYVRIVTAITAIMYSILIFMFTSKHRNLERKLFETSIPCYHYSYYRSTYTKYFFYHYLFNIYFVYFSNIKKISKSAFSIFNNFATKKALLPKFFLFIQHSLLYPGTSSSLLIVLQFQKMIGTNSSCCACFSCFTQYLCLIILRILA